MDDNLLRESSAAGVYRSCFEDHELSIVERFETVLVSLKLMMDIKITSTVI